MDRAVNVKEDTVFIGRYVLVEYGQQESSYSRLYQNDKDSYFYFSPNCEPSTRAIYTEKLMMKDTTDGFLNL